MYRIPNPISGTADKLNILLKCTKKLDKKYRYKKE